MAKTKNDRCPLQSECGKTCDYKFAEKSCPYYMANARPGFELDTPEPPPAFDAFAFDKLDDEIEEASEIYGYTDDEKHLTYIPVDQIYPHPDNPRKHLGDLGELSDSIKKNGIYQNLTVVPLKSKLKPNMKLNGYTVIIGHRRLEAAKLAGLTEVPCVIAAVTRKLDGEIDNLYWCIDSNGSWIYLSTDKAAEDTSAMDKTRAEAQRREEKRNRLSALCKTAKELRKNFVSEYTGKKDIVPFLLAKCFERGCILRTDESAAVELLSLGIDSDAVKNVFTSAEFLEVLTKQPQRALLLALWNGFEIGYRMTETYSWDLKYAQNTGLQRWYEILEAVGYQMSTEEQQMLDGTHPAYKDEEDGSDAE